MSLALASSFGLLLQSILLTRPALSSSRPPLLARPGWPQHCWNNASANYSGQTDHKHYYFNIFPFSHCQIIFLKRSCLLSQFKKHLTRAPTNYSGQIDQKHLAKFFPGRVLVSRVSPKNI